MRKLSFLPPEIFISLILLWIWILFKLPIGYKVLSSLLACCSLYTFRKAAIPYRDTLKNNGEIYLSPVHGLVESIRRDTTTLEDGSVTHEVRISIGGWDEKGLYLPTTGEVTYLKASKGLKIPRGSESELFYLPVSELAHTDFILKSKNQTQTLMRFIDCKYGKRPSVWLKYGDRGRGAACFGYYPFGGTLLIYLPQNSDILVFEKERIVPGQTVIAALKDLK